ncbi:hypothetical protein NM688_g4041 [Phlebia brevispora]|uniref:Uncharacterized protein n=1 Tax=Phlebia brevispora TaxID=194682 RepID=A0ACC1T3V4_9APHY|nr:hypothetical protein NM688_g4041 [Phlebia brevispora]
MGIVENCYPELNWIETWLNSSSTKKAIGIHPSASYVLISKNVHEAFHASGDTVRNSARLLPDLIQDGIRLLVYAGMAGESFIEPGNEAWVEQLDNKFHDEFKRSTSLPWKTIESDTKAGEVRFAGGGGFTAGNLTFVKVYEAGHMVPYDQPEAALDLFIRWIFDFPFHLPERMLIPDLGDEVRLRNETQTFWSQCEPASPPIGDIMYCYEERAVTAMHLLSLTLCWLVSSVRSLSYWSDQDVLFSPASFSEQNAVSASTISGNYSLRVMQPDPSLCDPTVKQYAGFLDVSSGKHLFFWFFESRISPENAPLTLWLSGGPGGSSAIGMLNALGPCNIANGGRDTTFNNYSWNTYSNMLFLDQPVGAGYSYSTDNSTVGTTPDAAEDMYAFLQLFLEKFPAYASAPFHVAAESYGGMYGPHIAALIYRKNKELASDPSSSTQPKKINLASVILANPYTDPKVQFPTIPVYVCDGPYALLDPAGSRCQAWKSKIPTCERLIQLCYDFDAPVVCVPAADYCFYNLYSELLDLGRNVYDVRRDCNVEHSGLDCYPEFDWIQTWLNMSSSKEAIGIDPSLHFRLASPEVGLAFDASGDSARNSATLLPPLIEDGIRLLVYAGEMDMTQCNFIGNERWMENLDSLFQEEFKRSRPIPWMTVGSGVKAGEVRYAGGDGRTAGNMTFVKVFQAGHMVPHDQPKAALDLFTRWIFNVPFTSSRNESPPSAWGSCIGCALQIRQRMCTLQSADNLPQIDHAAHEVFCDSASRTKLTPLEQTWGSSSKEDSKATDFDAGSVRLASLPGHQLRVTEPDPSLCDPTVVQHAGFLDITDKKHLFFWFFESRKSPEKAPLTLWLNGGPGGSSAMGMLFELGPCNIANEGLNTTFNPYSWNTYSNMIFLDQPAFAGYSYSSDNSTLNSTPDAAEDVYAFLQLFFAKYPQYASAPFHIAAESYGGMFGPHIGSVIHEKNKMLASMFASRPGLATELKTINLVSIILANGHTDPKVQFSSIPQYVCDGPYAVLDPNSTECVSWKEKVPTCERLIRTCYDFDTPQTCIPAVYFCWFKVWDPLFYLNKNVYDVRKTCGDARNQDCYPEFKWIRRWMNNSLTKQAIGIDPSLNFELVSLRVQLAFHGHGDSVRNSAGLLPELIGDGIRLLVYAGATDLACNFMGNEAWVEKLDNCFHDEFKQSKAFPWIAVESGRTAGEVRSATGGRFSAGNLTFVKVYDAGHMMPHDQPEAALDLFTRWIFDIPLHLPWSDATSLEKLTGL